MIHFTPKHHFEVLLNSWGTSSSLRCGILLYSRERGIGPPSFRASSVLGLPAWPPGLENHHLLFFHKESKDPKGDGLAGLPQANSSQPKPVVPRPHVHLRGLQGSQHLPSYPLPQLPQSHFSYPPFPELPHHVRGPP